MGSLFGKKYDSTDLLDRGDRGFAHLEWVVQPGKATVREPVAARRGVTGSIVILPYPQFDVPDYKEKNLVCSDCPEHASAEFGDQKWFFIAEGVRRFGKHPVTLLFDNPDDSSFEMKQHHPVQLLVDAAWKAKRGTNATTPLGSADSDKWADLLRGEGENYGCLPSPSKLALFNVMIYAQGKQPIDPGQPIGGIMSEPQAIWCMSQDTGKSFTMALNQLRENGTGPIRTPITANKVFHFFDKKNPAASCPAKAQAVAAGAGGLAFGEERRRATPMMMGQQQQEELGGYDVFITDTISGIPNAPDAPGRLRQAIIQYACRKLLPWEDVLRGHTPDQCAEVIGRYCGLPHSLLYHAWKSFGQKWWPEELKYKLSNPHTMAMGPGTPQSFQAPGGMTAPQAAPAAAPASQPAAVPAPGFSFGGAAAAPAAGDASPAGSFPFGSTPFDAPIVGSTESPPDPKDPGIDPARVKAAQDEFRRNLLAQQQQGGAPQPR